MLDSIVGVAFTAAAAAVAYWMYWRITHRRMLELASSVPGPPALPILGNALTFMVQPGKQLDIMCELTNKYGEYVKFWLGPDLNIVVSNPHDIRLLLTSNKVNQKGPAYEYMKPFIGPGILTGGPTWRNHRKIATPSYSKRSLQLFSRIFNREADELVRVLSTKNPDKSFNVFPDVLNSTTQSVCQTLMGLSKDESKNVKRMDEVVKQTECMYRLIFSRMTRWWLQIPLIYWATGYKKKENYFVKAVDEMTTDILQKRLEDRKKNKIVDEDAMGVADRYVLSGELTEQEIKWETFSLFTTSQEAGAKIASGVLLFLAHLPEWQSKVYNEIIEVLGSQNDDLDEEQLKKLQYLDMVFKEVLRYLPIAALIQRRVEEEIAINNGKITLPKGTSLVFAIHNLHRDTHYWEEPNKVKPERFLPENVKKRDPSVFIPFSLGPMDCLGRVFGTVMIKTLVVKALRHLQFEADGALEDLAINVAISVNFAKGYNLRVQPRNKGREHIRA